MGAVHSTLESCSGHGEEHRKDTLWSDANECTNNHYHKKHDNSKKEARSPTKANSHFSKDQKSRDVNTSSAHQTDGHQQRHPYSHSHGHLSSLAKGLSKTVSRVKTASPLRMVRKASSSMIHGSKWLLFHHHSRDDREENNDRDLSKDSKNPRSSIRHNSRHSRRGHRRPTPTVATKVRGGVLLDGCLTDQEHYDKVQQILEILRRRCSYDRNHAGEERIDRVYNSMEALTACGFEYRQVPLHEDGRPVVPPTRTKEIDNKNKSTGIVDCQFDSNSPFPLARLIEDEENDDENNIATNGKKTGDRIFATSSLSPKVFPPAESLNNNNSNISNSERSRCNCHCELPPRYMTMLFHTSTNTLITMKNRRQYIADGDMYDAIARAAMEYAQEVMMKDASLEWITIEESGNNPEPIRALISKRLLEDEARLDTEPTLLVITGSGKVRAGIFSRQHLLVSGMECSTAIPIVREATTRKMNIIMLDPNVRGDRLGMITFEKSMSRVFRRWEASQQEDEYPKLDSTDNHINSRCNNVPSEASSDSSSAILDCGRDTSSCRDTLFVLSHSASGAQFQRYLLDKYEHYVHHIRAICFTDSTHNIQWTKGKNELKELFESDRSVYFKSAKEKNDPILNPLRTLGNKLETDGFWHHRFGSIKTVCAGTSEHGLTNFFAQSEMWKHFDHNGLYQVDTIE